MNPTKQRIAIAEALGVKTFPAHQWEERDDRRYFICRHCGEYVHWNDYSRDKGITLDPCAGTERNYPDDLNAMHAVEESLNEEQRLKYAEFLTNNFAEEFCDLEGTAEHIFAVAHLGAPQRAEAFLKTVGKWIEDSK